MYRAMDSIVNNFNKQPILESFIFISTIEIVKRGKTSSERPALVNPCNIGYKDTTYRLGLEVPRTGHIRHLALICWSLRDPGGFFIIALFWLTRQGQNDAEEAYLCM